MALATAGSWLRFLLDGRAAIDTHRGSFVLASAVAGAGLILAGACALRLAPRARALGFAALWRWTFAAHAFALAALPLTSSDVFTNLAFGAVAVRGLSPYAHAPAELGATELLSAVPARWANDPSPYGPLFHPLVGAAAWVGERAGAPLWGSYSAWKALLTAALAGALAIAARHVRAHRADAAHEIFTVLALAPLLTWEVTAQGHNDGLLFLALVAFVAAAASERALFAVVSLTLGVAVKYALAPLLGLYLVLLARHSLRRAAALALAAAAVLAAAFAPELRSVTLRAVLPMLGGEAARHAHSFTDLACMVFVGLGWPRAALVAYRALSAASALLCAGLLARAALLSRTFQELAHGYLLFLLALYLTGPWFQPWYLAWAL